MTNSNITEGKALLEYILIGLCLCVIALRVTFTESLAVQSPAWSINISDPVYSLSLSAVLIFSFVSWLVWSFGTERFSYRVTGFEIGLGIFCVACIISALVASDKRMAITSTLTLLAPMLSVVLLVQILNSPIKIKIVLTIITALGVVCAYQCANQFFIDNQMTIEQYEQAPESLLEPLGIEPGTLQHFLFEHRLYSKEVRGFFTTSNSAGSFLLLASFVAVGLFIDKYKNRKSNFSHPSHLLTCGTAVAVVIFGLALTRSKGAIAASVVAAVVFAMYLNIAKKAVRLIIPIFISALSSLFLFTPQRGPVIEISYLTLVNANLTVLFLSILTVICFLCPRDWVWVIIGSVIAIAMGIIVVAIYYAWYKDYPLFGTDYFRAGLIAGNIAAGIFLFTIKLWGAQKNTILIVCLLLAVASGCLIVRYGLTHGRLPGGNSMLVRWQYWHASAKMYADHPLTGVGAGNFAYYYTRYKPASAPETVADPHNFLLSILTQYGPLGIIGFMAMISIPLWKVFAPAAKISSTKAGQSQASYKTLAIVFLITISAAMLFIRPMLIPITPTDNIEVLFYLIVTFYIAPVTVFVIGFLLLAVPLKKESDTRHKRRDTNIMIVALFCAILGVLLHNIIDFAFFEPGVFTTFCAILACLIVIDYQQKSRPSYILQPSFITKILIAVAGLIMFLVYLSYALTPVVKSTIKIQQAQHVASTRQFERAHRLLNQATEDDSLSPLALALNSRLYMQRYEYSQSKNQELLLEAEKRLKRAIQRNDYDFKNYERLSDVYTLLAENSSEQERTRWLEQAHDSILQAIELYPGCGRVHFKLAQIAERIGRNSLALEHYRKAVEIEDSYRQQFKIMYPGKKEIVSRLGEEKYQHATERMRGAEKKKKQD